MLKISAQRAAASQLTATSAGAEQADGKMGKAPAPKAASELILAGQARPMTRAAAQQDLEKCLKLAEAQYAAAKASGDLYKSAFNIFASSLLAAVKGGDAGIEDMAKGLQASSMEQAIKNSSKVLKMDDLHGCDRTGKELAAKITQVCGLVPKVLDTMSPLEVTEVQRLIVPIIKGQATWERVNYAVCEKCRRDERGVPGLCDLVDGLCAEAGAEAKEYKYVKMAAVTAVAVLLGS